MKAAAGARRETYDGAAPGWRGALFGLVGLHVAGALHHRLVLRDRVLQRMLRGS